MKFKFEEMTLFKMRSKFPISDILRLSIVSAVLLFFFQADLNYRPTSDDLYFFEVVNEFGVIDALTNLQQNKRPTSQLVSNLAYGFAGNFKGLTPVLSWALILIHSTVFLSLLLLVHSFSIAAGEFELGTPKKMAIAAVLMFMTYLGSSNPQEVWFWFSGATSYLLFVVAMGPLVYGLLRIRQKVGIWISSASLLFIGGLAENTAFVVFLLMLILLIHDARNNETSLSLVRVVPILFLVTPIVFSWMDGGYKHRLSLEHEKPLAVLQIPWEGVVFSWRRICLISLSSFYLISMVPRTSAVKLMSSLKMIPWIFPVALSIGVFIPLLIVFKTLSPSRAFFLFDIFLTATVLVIFWKSTLRMQFRSGDLRIAQALSGIVLLIAVISITIVTGSDLRNYSKNYDLRIEYILETPPGADRSIEVTKLADPRIIVAQDVSPCGSRSLNFTSQQLGPLLGKDCVICRSE